MRLEALIPYISVVAVVGLSILFRKRLSQYQAAHPKRLLVLGAIFLLSGKLFFIALPIYALYFFLHEYKAGQAVADTASSKISSAAQGYVEVIGQGMIEGGLHAPMSNTPCLWYRYAKYRTNGLISRLMLDRDQWELISSGTSDQPFMMHDGSAKCYVDPKGAQLSEVHYEEWFDGQYFYEEALLLPNKALYVLGDFVTQSAAKTRAELSKEVGALMATWKQDANAFRKRFDLDGDGVVDGQELELARMAATREVHEQLGLTLAPKSTISKPADGRPFVISHHPHKKLILRHKMHGWFYMGMFVLSVMMAVKVLTPYHYEPPKEDQYPKGWAALDLDPYRMSCLDLSGTYSTKSEIGTIKLSDSFLWRHMKPDLFAEKDKIFLDWDTVTIGSKEVALPSAQKISKHYAVVTLERSPQKMQAYETRLARQSPDQYREYQKITTPEAIESKTIEKTSGSYRFDTTDHYESAIDTDYLWHSYRYELDKSTPDYQCKDGWVVSAVKAENDAQHRWMYVAIAKDKAGNLVAKQYYEPEHVMNWTRWPPTQPAWSAAGARN